MHQRGWITTGALLGGVGVALGAFGAHGLERRLLAAGHDAQWVEQALANFETAVRYQMYHALAILAVGVLLGNRRSTLLQATGWAFLIGTGIFSGMLYLYVAAGPDWRWMGAIVPIGGLAMFAGWFLLAAAAWRSSS